MPDMSGLAGPIAIAVICFLIFIEEAGVPLPMFPGDGLLLAAGVMITAGQISPWLFFPLAYVSAVAGATTGYAWSRRLGKEGLERLADRLRLRRHLDGASDRLRRTGSLGVVVGRMLPGTRVYTNLVAGAGGVSPAEFFRGMVVAALLWLGLFTGLGILVGVPALRYIHQIEAMWTTLALQLAAIALLGACLHWLRPPAGLESRRSRAVRLAAAAIVDLAVVGLAAVAVYEALLPYDLHLTVLLRAGILAYIVVARLLFGSTAGERVLRVSYRDAMVALGRTARAAVG